MRAGIERVQDFNDPTAPAACTGLLDVAVDPNSYRQSTYHTFLPPQLARKRQARLKLCTRAVVSRVQLEHLEGDLRATGVFFQSMDPKLVGQEYFARARREVILCAGALVSPQILMLRFVIIHSYSILFHPPGANCDLYSGLGPKDHLAEKGVTVARDIPAVGSHLVRFPV